MVPTRKEETKAHMRFASVSPVHKNNFFNQEYTSADVDDGLSSYKQHAMAPKQKWKNIFFCQ